MKQITVMLEPDLIKSIDDVVKNEGLYHSRNDFIRDAARQKIIEFRKMSLRKAATEMNRIAKSRGWDGTLLTKEEREKIAVEFAKEKGFLK